MISALNPLRGLWSQSSAGILWSAASNDELRLHFGVLVPTVISSSLCFYFLRGNSRPSPGSTPEKCFLTAQVLAGGSLRYKGKLLSRPWLSPYPHPSCTLLLSLEQYTCLDFEKHHLVCLVLGITSLVIRTADWVFCRRRQLFAKQHRADESWPLQT